MAINENGTIDTPFELLIIVLLAFIFIILLFKLGNLLENLPVITPKTKKKKEVVKEVKKEVKKEIVKDKKENISDKDKSVSVESNTNTNNKSNASVNSSCGSAGENVCPYANMMPMTPSSSYDKYLYDRFAVAPTSIDRVADKKISESFLSDDEIKDIQGNNVNIKVNDVDASISSKESLHKRISQMTNQNKATREKLLDEFEGLSREMKLLIIENIIQKM